MATPVSRLQEYYAKRYEKAPEYFIENVGTITDVKFKCTVTFGDNLQAVGIAKSKQEAKHKSASNALEILCGNNNFDSIVGKINSDVVPVISTPNKVFVNHVGILNEYASTHRQLYPNYKECIGVNAVTVECHFLSFTTKGYSRNKKDAKQEAAKKMMDLIDQAKLDSKFEITAKKEVDGFDQIDNVVLKKFEDLQKTFPELQITEPIIDTEYRKTSIDKKIRTEEDLKTELNKVGISYKLETVQSQPYILSITTGSGRVVLGVGDTRQLALEDLIETALDMVRNGFRL